LMGTGVEVRLGSKLHFDLVKQRAKLESDLRSDLAQPQPKVEGDVEGKQPFEMTREEFEASQPVVRKGFSSIKEGERIDTLPDEATITVFHATDSATAKKFDVEGILQSDKPLNLARIRFEAGEEAEFAPGRGLASGLTVGIDPREVSGFGRQIIAIQVRKGQIRISPEQAGLGVTSPGVALAASDAFIEGDISAEDVTLIGKPGREPKHPHEELVRAAVREGKTVPPEVLAEFPDLAQPQPKAEVTPEGAEGLEPSGGIAWQQAMKNVLALAEKDRPTVVKEQKETRSQRVGAMAGTLEWGYGRDAGILAEEGRWW
jgi:hypothetical protein